MPFDNELFERNTWIMAQNGGVMPPQNQLMKYIQLWEAKKIEAMMQDPEQLKQITETMVNRWH